MTDAPLPCEPFRAAQPGTQASIRALLIADRIDVTGLERRELLSDAPLERRAGSRLVSESPLAFRAGSSGVRGSRIRVVQAIKQIILEATFWHVSASPLIS